MNQILVTDRVYVTKKLKRKKKFYKCQFILSLILVLFFVVWYVYSVIDKNLCEAVSQEILDGIDFSDLMDDDGTNLEDMPLVISMDIDDEDDYTGEDPEEAMQANQTSNPVKVANGSYTDKSGTTYNYESILRIPKIGIEYPVLSETSDELLKISLNKFWGGSPNSVGNYCVVGHNYKSGRMFGKLSSLQVGDEAKLTDLSGKTLTYKVYDRFIVYPDDVACTSQVTNGLKEMTLITCCNGGKQRLVLKCREV